MISLFISAALYLFFRRFFPPTEASARDNEYLHCIQTHGQKTKQKKNSGSCRTNSSPCCSDSLTAALGNGKNSTLGGEKFLIYTHCTILHTSIWSCCDASKAPTFKSLIVQWHTEGGHCQLWLAGRQSRAEGGTYSFLGSSERPVRLFLKHTIAH